MDRKTLLAVVLIMAVLMLDQVLWSRWTKPKRSAVPGDSVTVVMPPGAGDSLAAGAGRSGTGGSAIPLPTPSEASSSASRFGAPTMAGEAILSARVAPAPATFDSLSTPYFSAIFTSQGGAVRSWEVRGYKNPRLQNVPVNLIPEGQTAFHVVVGVTGVSYDFSRASFRRVGGGADGSISFAAEDSSGIRVTKTYRVGRDPSLLDLELRVSAPPQLGPVRYRFGWANPLPLTELNARPIELTSTAYLGTKLEIIDAGKIAKVGVRRLEGNVRWAAQRSKYFIASVIPDSATIPEVLFQAGPEKLPVVWLSGAAPPGTDVVRHARLYAGPIQYETLVRIGAGLEDVAKLAPWKWIVPVSALLLKALELFYKVIPNYGVAIILLSLFTKIIFYPLTQSSLRTMKVMHRLQPEVTAIRERHAKDPAKMNEAMMRLYKEHKVNPVGGCLPMLLQLPVFLALYQVLLHAIELRSAGFMGYIKDLSAPDVLTYVGSFPIHLLPLIMTASTFLLQMQTPVDPRQQFMMYLMPVLMLYIMYSLPSGVILYWTVNNLVSALQQYLVNVAEDRRMGVRT